MRSFLIIASLAFLIPMTLHGAGENCISHTDTEEKVLPSEASLATSLQDKGADAATSVEKDASNQPQPAPLSE